MACKLNQWCVIWTSGSNYTPTCGPLYTLTTHVINTPVFFCNLSSFIQCNYIWAMPKYIFNRTLNLLFSVRFCKTLFLPEFLSNQLEILTQHPQSSQEGAMTFLRHPSCSSGLIQDFLDHYTLEWQKAVPAYL